MKNDAIDIANKSIDEFISEFDLRFNSATEMWMREADQKKLQALAKNGVEFKCVDKKSNFEKTKSKGWVLFAKTADGRDAPYEAIMFKEKIKGNKMSTLKEIFEAKIGHTEAALKEEQLEIGSVEHYKKWVKDKGHLTDSASSVFGEYSKEFSLDKDTHNKLVSSVFKNPQDIERMKRR